MDATAEFDLTLTDDERALLGRAREFAEAEVRPAANGWEHERRYPLETLRAACRAGLASVELPREQGGLGLRFAAKMRMCEELARHDFAFAFALVNHHNAIVRVAEALPAATARRLVPLMLDGERIGATALSEPTVGSDFAEIATVARRTGGAWLLDGHKRWITGAAVADVFITYAQTQPGSRGRGVAGFLVDGRREGFQREAPQALPGIWAAGIGGFVLTRHPVPDEHLLLAAGDAFKGAMRSVNKARIYVAAMAAGMIDASLAQALAWGRQRTAFGRPLRDHQGWSWALADVATTLEALRLLVYRATAQVERGEDAQLSAALAKKFAGDHCAAAINRCVQAMGARGLSEEHALPRHLSAARALAYADGTTEMMNERIGVFLHAGR